MFRPAVIFAIANLFSLFSLPSLAQARQLPQPDSQGNYTSAVTIFPDGSKAVLLSWFTNIQSSRLNCRRRPGLNQQVIQQFLPNDLIQADAGVHNSQEPIVQDTQGNPWLQVRIINHQGRSQGSCFVRANQQFIAPNSLE
jgi:hypothetical protein